MLYLDVFDHKSIGIFPLLDDECKIREPSVRNFTYKLRSMCDSSHVVDPNLRVMNCLHNPENTFIIRHFAGAVRYSTVLILYLFAIRKRNQSY